MVAARPFREMKKVIVIGSGGAGKSTFSKRLGKVLSIDVIHLDLLYWKPNWVKTPAEEWSKVVEKIVSRDSWIIDGNFGGTRELRIRASDSVIFLDIPRRVCLYRLLKRFVLHRGRNRPDMTVGCNERFDMEFLQWVWNYPKISKPRIMRRLGELTDKQTVVLRSSRQAEEFLSTIDLSH